MGALNIPSAADIERLTRRLRSVAQRLEGIEDALDRLDRRLESSTKAARRRRPRREDRRADGRRRAARLRAEAQAQAQAEARSEGQAEAQARSVGFSPLAPPGGAGDSGAVKRALLLCATTLVVATGPAGAVAPRGQRARRRALAGHAAAAGGRRPDRPVRQPAGRQRERALRRLLLAVRRPAGRRRGHRDQPVPQGPADGRPRARLDGDVTDDSERVRRPGVDQRRRTKVAFRTGAVARAGRHERGLRRLRPHHHGRRRHRDDRARLVCDHRSVRRPRGGRSGRRHERGRRHGRLDDARRAGRR